MGRGEDRRLQDAAGRSGSKCQAASGRSPHVDYGSGAEPVDWRADRLCFFGTFGAGQERVSTENALLLLLGRVYTAPTPGRPLRLAVIPKVIARTG